jgi:hypothetical protein
MIAATKKTTDKPTDAEKQAKIEEYIANTHGTQDLHKQAFTGGRFVYTDGLEFIAETAGAYWLIDAIASHAAKRRLMADPMLRDFQIWVLKVNQETREAVLTCKAGTGCRAAVRQVIPYTDFPMAEIKFYVERGGHHDAAGNIVSHLCLMLPEER